MRAKQRLDRLAAGLPPKEGTLLWLEEAHRLGSLTAYVRWLFDRPVLDAPLERIIDGATRAVRQAMRGVAVHKPVEAEHRIERDAAFLFQVVLQLNAAAERSINLGGVRFGLLFWQQRAVGVEAPGDVFDGPVSPEGTMAGRWADWREALAAFLVSLYRESEARRILEARYLDGHHVLFPDTLADWERLVEAAEELAAVGDGLIRHTVMTADPSQADPTTLDLDVLRELGKELAPSETEHIVAWARAAALDILGDTRAAGAAMARIIRSRPAAEAS